MSTTLVRIVPREYRDSVSLMKLSSMLAALPGIEQAAAIMATPNNLALLTEAGLAVRAPDAAASDLLIMLKGDEAALPDAMSQAIEHLDRRVEAAARREALSPRSIEMALGVEPEAGLALISTPGEYAAAEAMKALRLGLDVMLFSDNVALADEVRLKRFAREHGLLVMGPDCGTAIIDGVPLAFANVVARGNVGIVGASGTGTQEVSVLLDKLGSGVSHAIGTGGRDLNRDVGGISMLRGLELLAADDDTEVVVLISKPPDAEVARQLLRAAEDCGKPVVVNFLGLELAAHERVHGAKTLEDAARLAVCIATGKASAASRNEQPSSALPRFAAEQRYLRGLYSGGTFCYEAALLLTERLSGVHSNASATHELDDPWRSREHTLIDLGDDVFTRGRAHPMIDYRLRVERILEEAADPQTAVIALDVVLGFGSHPDPAAELVPALNRAHELAQRRGANIVFVGHICGTERDPQVLSRQQRALSAAGMLLVNSNAQAARLAASIVETLNGARG